MNFSIERKIAAGFGVGVVVLLLIAVAAAWNGRRFDETFRMVEHTHEVLARFEDTLVGVLAMQSNTRGFVLSGSAEVREAFESAQSGVKASLLELRRLTKDNPKQQQRLDELDHALAEATALMHRRIVAREQTGLPPPTENPPSLEGQRAVNRLRGIVQALQEEERRLLAERSAHTQSAAHSTIIAALVGGFLAVAFLLGSGLVVRRDFHQRVKAEQAMRKSEQMFQRLFNDAPDAIVQVNHVGTIVRANKQVEILFGWPRAELPGHPLSDLIPPKIPGADDVRLAEYFAAPGTRETGIGNELSGRRKDRTEFPADIMLSPLETDEGLQSLVVIRDVTARRAADDQIRHLNLDLQLQNARLANANKELESFSYSVSHDLRAPLRHIDGFASLLSKHAGLQLDDKGTRFLNVITESARRMGRLIDDLLSFSRMGRAQMDLDEVDHRQLVAGVIRERMAERDKAVQWDIQPLPPVRADAAMLRQVWFNLIDNAAKYSAGSNPPRIEIGSLPPTTEAPRETTFYIRDNGVGFDLKYASKLFGVFQRLHSEAEFEGTGIGLANIRRIINRHGGRTWAESQLGHGATFYFTLPTAPPPSSSTPHLSSS